MMIFTSIYGVDDWLFISNCVGSDAFAVVNLIFPPIMIFCAFGFMIGTGGSALVSKAIGEGNKKKANEIFSMLIFLLIGLGMLLMWSESELLDKWYVLHILDKTGNGVYIKSLIRRVRFYGKYSNKFKVKIIQYCLDGHSNRICYDVSLHKNINFMKKSVSNGKMYQLCWFLKEIWYNINYVVLI